MLKKSNIKISIITATYNSSELIQSTYDSIARQDYINWEWLVTDDCSDDNTWSILEGIARNDPRVSIYKNDKNSGAAVSRNNSMSHAEGEFFAFIDSDDLWLNGKLKRQIDFMENNKVDFSFTAYEMVDQYGIRLGKSVDSNQEGCFSYRDMLLKKATLGCSTVMIRRSAFPKLSMPLLRTGQDYATWLNILRTGTHAYVIRDVLTQYRITPNSISRNKLKKAKRQWQIYREIERLSLIDSMICFSSYARNAIFRK